MSYETISSAYHIVSKRKDAKDSNYEQVLILNQIKESTDII